MRLITVNRFSFRLNNWACSRRRRSYISSRRNWKFSDGRSLDGFMIMNVNQTNTRKIMLHEFCDLRGHRGCGALENWNCTYSLKKKLRLIRATESKYGLSFDLPRWSVRLYFTDSIVCSFKSPAIAAVSDRFSFFFHKSLSLSPVGTITTLLLAELEDEAESESWEGLREREGSLAASTDEEEVVVEAASKVGFATSTAAPEAADVDEARICSLFLSRRWERRTTRGCCCCCCCSSCCCCCSCSIASASASNLPPPSSPRRNLSWWKLIFGACKKVQCCSQ